jgi:hypothetical protein
MNRSPPRPLAKPPDICAGLGPIVELRIYRCLWGRGRPHPRSSVVYNILTVALACCTRAMSRILLTTLGFCCDNCEPRESAEPARATSAGLGVNTNR